MTTCAGTINPTYLLSVSPQALRNTPAYRLPLKPMSRHRSFSAPTSLSYPSLASPSLRKSSISSLSSAPSSSSSSSSSSNIFANWQIPPPSRTYSVTEGVEPYVDPERYDPRPALKCLTDFRTVDWGRKTEGVEESPLVSPGGTSWDDLDKDMRDTMDLRDKLFEEEERREKYGDDVQERTKYARKRRQVRRKERLRTKGKEFRLPVGEWVKVKEAFGLEDRDLEGDDEEEGEGGLGLWLKIALRRSKNQRQVSLEKSETGSSEEDSRDYEKTTRVSGSLHLSYWEESSCRVGANHRNRRRSNQHSLTPEHRMIDFRGNEFEDQRLLNFGRETRRVAFDVWSQLAT
ncbi:MAG: hypothetical protein Q9209_002139 [Squamulea sp. 1 TL-2023]